MYESEIKAIRIDNGTEFKNYTMQEFVYDEGIKHDFPAPYTPQQNGVVERKNRTIIEMARTMLSEFKSPHNFWGEAISTVFHYSNRIPYIIKLHTTFSQDNGSQVEKVVPCAAGNDEPSNSIKLMGIGHIRPTKVHTNDKDDGIEIHLLLKRSHILKNKKKTLTPLSKTMMLINNHPHLVVKLKLSLMIKN
ncbi:hypothetical protein QYE76_055880 [Lolium multiflorum]|uniref:Integrase catalytic domain-containing protein n=1 Tax=Lolium multiflorum TaxID=4521 RepID=A0AAD8WMP8_LOLMU|nr:hypothetical protein QYE76_055880 [Lolium multiflorum]